MHYGIYRSGVQCNAISCNFFDSTGLMISNVLVSPLLLRDMFIEYNVKYNLRDDSEDSRTP